MGSTPAGIRLRGSTRNSFIAAPNTTINEEETVRKTQRKCKIGETGAGRGRGSEGGSRLG